MPSSPDTRDAEAPSSAPEDPSRRRLGVLVQCLLWAGILATFADAAAASNGLTLSKRPRDTLAVPRWLYLATGGATIGASALLATFVTDRALVRTLHGWSRAGLTVTDRWAPLGWITRAAGVATLALAVYLGYTGPQLPAASPTVLVTFAGVRAGLPMLTYLGGNVWPLIDPWRTLASPLPTGVRTYPDRARRWPAVVGLLTLVWVEVVFPVSTVPRVLATAILGYSAVTLAGAVVFGSAAWFRNADPLAVLFRLFGAVAPVQRRDGALRVGLPGRALVEDAPITDASDVAFVVALIWELTFSGFITTDVGAATVRSLVALLPRVAGVEPLAIAVYTALFVCGYAVFVGAYWYASVLSRRYTGTYLTVRTIAVRFAPPLLAIAAGYHLAHYAGLFVTLSPALLGAVLSPLSPPANPLVLSPPAWFDGLSIGFVLVGHLLAIGVAHAVAYDLFSSRLTAIRSQYPFVAVMIGYTVVSLWILSLPGAIPPYL
ncbi:MAG: hypothetical protein ABEI80_05345 [Haloplanus sp.]